MPKQEKEKMTGSAGYFQEKQDEPIERKSC
jgi:hypothetical protein